MRMLSSDQKLYPKTAYYVRVDMAKIATSELYFDVYRRLAGATRTLFREMLHWGHGPLVVPAELDVWTTGEFRGTEPTKILISRRRVLEFESGRDKRYQALGGTLGPSGMVYYLGVIILHELAHWADYQRPADQQSKTEEGEQLERELFGSVQLKS